MNDNKDIHKSKARDVYWQYVRGICIICVVLIHCKTGIEYRNELTNSWNFDYWMLLRQFINFPVAIFIFLAGYFVNIEKAREINIPYIYNRGGGEEALNTIFSLVNFLYH